MDVQTHDEVLQALIVPLSRFNLVVPQSLVLEVVPLSDLQAVDGAEPWLCGFVDWQGSGLPLVSLEALCGNPVEPAAIRRVAILRSLEQALPLSAYAIAIDAIPHPVKLKRSDMSQLEQPLVACNEVLVYHVNAAGVNAAVADFSLIEQRLAAVLPQA